MTTEIDVTREVTDLTEIAKSMVVKDKASFDRTSRLAVDLQKMRKVVKEYHKPLKAATFAAHKTATGRENSDLAPLEAADKYLRTIRSQYVAKEDEKRRKEQERKDAIAERKAEKERERLRKKAEAEQDEEKVQAIEEEIENVYVEPVIVQTAIAKSSKIEGGGGSTWVDQVEVEVTSRLLLCSEIASGRVPVTVVDFKPAKLKAWVKAMAVKDGVVKGIRIKTKRVERVRTG